MPESTPTPTTGLFDGDTSLLPVRLRQALVMLLKNTYIDGVESPEYFDALVRGREQAVQWLNGIFLTVDINEETRTAFKRAAVSRADFTEQRVIANTRKLRLYEGALLVWAREQIKRAQQEGLTSIIVTRSEIRAGLHYLDTRGGTDETIHLQAVDEALRALITQRYLSPHNAEDTDTVVDEYRLHPVILHIMDARRIEAFTDAISALRPHPETEHGDEL